MELVNNLNGSLVISGLLSVVVYVFSAVALSFLSKKSILLKPIGSGLKLIMLFAAIQIFLRLGAMEYHPRLSRQIEFISWIIFAYAALRLVLYIYGDLFVVRWRQGSFPAAFKNIITALVIVVVALALMKEILNINVTSLIATTTVLTATVGLAFQSTLANMLAGLTIHLEKPLKQGDWIAAAGHEGRVVDITLRSTRIMTIDHNEVFIPNSKVLSEAVVNFSRPDTLQTRKLEIGVHYHVPPNKVKQVILDALSSVPGVRMKSEPLVRVMRYGENAVNYEIRYLISDHARHVDIESEIMGLLWYRFRRHGIDIPMPVRDVRVTEVTSESRKQEMHAHTEELVAIMKRVDILSPLTPEELRELAQRVRIEQFATGEMPVRQGDSGDTFYIIKNGRVDVIVQRSTGEPATVATLGAGDFFGEMSLLTGATRTASIRIKDDAELLVIGKESFSAVLTNNPSIAESLSLILSSRQSALHAELERLDTRSHEHHQGDSSGELLKKIKDFFGLHS